MNYKKVYDQIIERSQTELELRKSYKAIGGYYEGHHIMPKCLGGTGKSINWDHPNITPLTAKEHFIVHKLLVEVYPEQKKLVYALWGMSNQLSNQNTRRDYRVSSREYERARELFSLSLKGREVTWGFKISKTKTGTSTGVQSEHTKSKRKATMKETPYHHTEERKRKISEKLKGTVKTPEWCEKISKTHKARNTIPPYRGIAYEYEGVTYRSKAEASRVLSIPRYKL